MATIGSGRSELFWPMILIVGTLGMGLLVTSTPLRSHRPSPKQDAVTSIREADMVPARLWEDPFEITARIWRNAPKKPTSNPLPGTQLLTQYADKHQFTNEDVPRTLLLPVLIADGGAPPMVDARIGARYAVHAAMSVGGYVPSNGTQVSVLRIRKPHVNALLDEAGDPMSGPESPDNTKDYWLVPIDHYSVAHSDTPDADQYESVHVLWVNMGELRRTHALRDLDKELLACLTPANSQQANATPKRVDVAILGPFFSHQLRQLVTELRDIEPLDIQAIKQKTATTLKALHGGRLYSAWATAADKDIRFEGSGNLIRRKHESLYYRAGAGPNGASVFSIERTVGPDSDLLFLLKQELDRRGVDALRPGKHRRKDHIAIISEVDSLYGQSIVREFMDKSEVDWSTSNQSLISQYSYISGLDGQGRQSTTQIAASQSSGARPDLARQLMAGQPESALAWSELERAQGPSQIDYVRRLVERLKRDNRRWKKRGERLRAIGVLGTDIYDKMIVLKAMREHFPDVIFFTTDLDAQMLNPADYRWTKNLIIASHYGLEAGPALQMHIPPFRNSYQTAVLISVLKALRDKRVDEVPPPIGRVYELGRHGAYDLRIEVEQLNDSKSEERRWLAARPRAIEPDDYMRRTNHNVISALFPLRDSDQVGLVSQKRLVFFVIATFVGFSLIIFGFHTWTRNDDDEPSSDTDDDDSDDTTPAERSANRSRAEWKSLFLSGLAAYAVLVGAPLLVFLLFVIPDHYSPGGEPFELFEGLSVWPTVLLRFFAGTLAIWFLYRIRRSLDQNAEHIEREFGLPRIEPEPPRDGPILRLLPREWIDPRWWQLETTFGWRPERGADAQDIWKEYRKRTIRRQRYLRTWPVLTMYLTFGFMFFLLYGFPMSPYRGATSHLALTISLFFAVISVNLLVFFVWDATRLCDRLVRYLSRDASNWPAQVLAKLDRPTEVVSPGKPKQSAAEAVESWLDCQIIAQRTGAVGRILYYPFVVLLVMIVSRHGAIDNWSWSAPLLLVISCSLLVMIIAAATLRRSATIARQREIERLQSVRAGAIAKGRDGETLARFSGELLQEIKDLREGAFGGVLQNPIVGALLVPASGVGFLEILSFLGA